MFQPPCIWLRKRASAPGVGELEADQAFVGDFCCASADHVADVDFGDFVVGQVDIGQSGFGQLAADDGEVLGTCGCRPTKMWAFWSSP